MRVGSTPTRPTYMGMVPNKEIREAFLRSALSASDVANYCGWFRGKYKQADDTRVNRALGLMKVKNKSGYAFNKRMHEETALKIIEAMNYDPVDFRDTGL